MDEKMDVDEDISSICESTVTKIYLKNIFKSNGNNFKSEKW